MIDRLTSDLLALFLVVAAAIAWYKRISTYHSTAAHRIGSHEKSTWVGELSDQMHRRIKAKLSGERIYTLYVGSHHRGSMA